MAWHRTPLSPAVLRQHSIQLVEHARELREGAEAARARSVKRREQSLQALASARNKWSLVEAILARRHD